MAIREARLVFREGAPPNEPVTLILRELDDLRRQMERDIIPATETITRSLGAIVENVVGKCAEGARNRVGAIDTQGVATVLEGIASSLMKKIDEAKPGVQGTIRTRASDQGQPHNPR